MDCSPPGSSVHGISQARILEWAASSFSRGSSRPGSPALQADCLPTELQERSKEQCLGPINYVKFSEPSCSHWTLYGIWSLTIPGSGRSPGEGIGYPLQYSWAFLVAQMVKNLPEIQETWVWCLGWEDPLEEGIATSILAWRIPWTGEPGRLQLMGLQRVGHDLATTEIDKMRVAVISNFEMLF